MPGIRRRSEVFRLAAAASLLAACLLVAGGCATAPRPAAPPAAAGEKDLWSVYVAAVDAAKYPEPDHVSKHLVPLLRSTPGLVWDQSGNGPRVLMVSWTKARYYDQKQPPYAYTIPDKVEVWLTAVPFLRQFCRETGLAGNDLILRLEQRLGMPPTDPQDADDAFVEMWVDPRTIFRPCPDPEVIDFECQVDLTAGPPPASASCPWSDALQGQLSGAFTTVSQAHLEWMCANWLKSYPADPKQGYPWTALGYTYDWGGKDFHGESEFVAPSLTQVEVRSITRTEDYCKPDRHP